MGSTYTNITRQVRVLVVEIDNPPVNALSPGVPEAIGAVLGDAERDPSVDAIVIDLVAASDHVPSAARR